MKREALGVRQAEAKSHLRDLCFPLGSAWNAELPLVTREKRGNENADEHRLL